METNGETGEIPSLSEIVSALAKKAPVYRHPEWRSPAPEEPGRVGWLDVNGSGLARMIFLPGYGWVSFHHEWPEMLEVEPRISFNA